MDELIYTIAFSRVSKIPPAVKKNLLDRFGGASVIFDSARSSHEGLECLHSPALEELRGGFGKEAIEDEIAEAAKNKIDIIAYGSADYPEALRNIPDPPLVLFKKGADLSADAFYFAVVGARRCSDYGKETAFSFSRDLAVAGMTIVSGMAIGIDTMAHKGCLSACGSTVAVLGSGILAPYPPENKGLFEEIANKGTVISEFGLHGDPLPENFPKRNRIISGLSRGVLIVEASVRSGARITARLALEQDRDVFAIPGRVDSGRSDGTNALIRDGQAKLTMSHKDILIEYPGLFDLAPENDAETADSAASMDETERRIYNLLEDEREVTLDELLEKSSLSIDKLLDIILRFELKGIVSRGPGNKIAKEM